MFVFGLALVLLVGFIVGVIYNGIVVERHQRLLDQPTQPVDNALRRATWGYSSSDVEGHPCLVKIGGDGAHANVQYLPDPAGFEARLRAKGIPVVVTELDDISSDAHLPAGIVPRRGKHMYA